MTAQSGPIWFSAVKTADFYIAVTNSALAETLPFRWFPKLWKVTVNRCVDRPTQETSLPQEKSYGICA